MPLSVFQSVAAQNSGNGFVAVSTAAAVDVNLVNSMAANTTTNGIAVTGAAATVRMVNTATLDNTNGISITAGTVAGTTPDTNLNAGNITDGAPNVNVTLQ